MSRKSTPTPTAAGPTGDAPAASAAATPKPHRHLTQAEQDARDAEKHRKRRDAKTARIAECRAEIKSLGVEIEQLTDEIDRHNAMLAILDPKQANEPLRSPAAEEV